MSLAFRRIEDHQVPTCEGPRTVTVAIPESPLQHVDVVYCADGQVVPELAAALQQSTQQVALPCLVGVHSVPQYRAEEYLYGTNEPARYRWHEQFFAMTVREYAVSAWGLAKERQRNLLFGFSNGGAFAVATALRDPLQFAVAIACSVPRMPDMPVVDSGEGDKPCFYLAAGDLGPEKAIAKHTRRLASWVEKHGLNVDYFQRSGGHNHDFWTREFTNAMAWFRRAVDR